MTSAPRLRGAAGRPRKRSRTRSSTACAGWCAGAWCCKSLRLRLVSVTDRLPRFGAPPEPPLQSYAANPAPRIAEGLRISRECVQADRRRGRGVRRADDGDADAGAVSDRRRRLRTAGGGGRGAGGTLVRDAATDAFRRGAGAARRCRRSICCPCSRERAAGRRTCSSSGTSTSRRAATRSSPSALEAFIRGQRPRSARWSSTRSTSSGSSSSSTRCIAAACVPRPRRAELAAARRELLLLRGLGLALPRRCSSARRSSTTSGRARARPADRPAPPPAGARG